MDSSKWDLVPVAQDNVIVPQTYQAQGTRTTMRVYNKNNAYLRFNEIPAYDVSAIKSAYLVLYDVAQYGATDILLFAGGQDWFEGDDVHSGSTRQYIDYPTTEWITPMGDWQDANGVANGDAAFSVTPLIDNDTTMVAWRNKRRIALRYDG